jgi:hypothetical protein
LPRLGAARGAGQAPDSRGGTGDATWRLRAVWTSQSPGSAADRRAQRVVTINRCDVPPERALLKMAASRQLVYEDVLVILMAGLKKPYQIVLMGQLTARRVR